MMDRKVEYIWQVAQYGSILKASEKLYITPSALSKYISKTEEELGVPLFDRIGKRFVLTYAGERYLKWMRQIMGTQKEMQKELRDIAAAKCGRIRFGVQTSGIEYIVQEVLPAFYEQYPQVKVEMYEDTSRNLRWRLEDSFLDFAIIPGVEDTPALNRILLAKSHRVLVLPKEYPLIRQAHAREGFTYPWIQASLLEHECFIAPFDTQNAYQVFSVFQNHCGFSPNIVFQTKNFGTLIKCVKSGIGVTISEDHIVKAARLDNEVEMLSFGDTDDAEMLQVCYLKDHYIDQATRTMIKLILDIYSV